MKKTLFLQLRKKCVSHSTQLGWSAAGAGVTMGEQGAALSFPTAGWSAARLVRLAQLI